MSISAITIENFKGIREPVRVELKPITLLFGPNSAGKSTIVQALHYAREIFERQNLDPDKTMLGGETMDLGGFRSLVHKHDIKLPIKIGFELDLRNEDLPEYDEGYEELHLDIAMNMLDEEEQRAAEFFYLLPRHVESAEVSITVGWSDFLGKPVLSSYAVSLDGKGFAELTYFEKTQRVGISRLNFFHKLFLDEDEKEEFKRLIEEKPDDEGAWFLRFYHFGLARLTTRIVDFEKANPIALSLGRGTNIGVQGQLSALPSWGRPLAIDGSFQDSECHHDAWRFFVKMISSLVVGSGELVRDALRKLCYVGPIREVPKRDHRPLCTPEESRWANGSAAYDLLYLADDEFIENVNEWLTQEDRLNVGYRVEVKKYRELESENPLMLAVLQGRILDEDLDFREGLLSLPEKRRLLIRDEVSNIELSPRDIGVGISQVLPVIVAALHHRTGLVAIEQPELHIHPGFQVALGDLFIEQVRERPDLTFLLETHSEHLMLRFLRRIRETSEKEAPEGRTLTPAELSVYFIEQGETGISCLSIRVDEDGDFVDPWPNGFFAERAKELF